MNQRSPIYLLLFIWITTLFSCVGTAPTREVRFIDSLNYRAYMLRYKDLDSSYQLAKLAYEETSLYKQGKAEACNNLGFYAFMRMDFDEAERCYREVYSLTQNELELLIADVGMMKIYQRTSMNKEFYDYRNNALRRIRRLDEERNLFVGQREKTRLNFAYTEFSIVSAIYYYYLQQMNEAIISINEIKPEVEFENDTSQLLYYHYIKGSASLTNEERWERKQLNDFDELYLTWRLASRYGYTYFEGNSLQGLANLMVSPDNFEFFLNRRSYLIAQFGLPVDTMFPFRLARMALEKFKEYNDIYQIAGAYVSIARYLNEHSNYAEALDSLNRALDCVNEHHRMFYSGENKTDDVLYTYVERDTAYAEIGWITGMRQGGEHVKVKTVPEWISRIREQLSVSYAGMGMKKESDYNRNIYLDILKYTRQDKELESRYSVLEKESKQLNWLLLLILVLICILIVLFWFFNGRAKKRNQNHLKHLRLTLDICQKITASVPSDVEEEEDIIAAIKEAILPDMRVLTGVLDMGIRLDNDLDESKSIVAKSSKQIRTAFPLFVPDKEQPIGVLELFTLRPISKEERTLIQVISPYIAWTLDNGMTFISLGDEQEKLKKQRYVFEQHIAKNKRENLIKKSCLAIVNGIVPYIDRILNEVYKLKEKSFAKNEVVRREKFQYINELVTTINEYNDILALWIKMKQGSLSLNIENFELNELFSLVAKGRKTFEMKKQTFDVEPTSVITKADKALTLFMINTLTENARKYTAEGGTVRVYAKSTDAYVEISVEDNGRGLSDADMAMIKGEKVYDSRVIGMNEAAAEELKRIKGSGFGLMNCKGIIEKYRKTNTLFNVCVFDVESSLGKGSRFFFRLPLGIKKILGVLLCLLLPFGLTSCHKQVAKQASITTDSVKTANLLKYAYLLDEASAYADTAYYCNVTEEYELALEYIDSAMTQLNRHYNVFGAEPKVFMELISDSSPAELTWWENFFDSDYSIILQIRNEAAVAFLALREWDDYSYNNKAYTALYKLSAEDQSLEAYCREFERSTTNKAVGVLLCVLLFLSSLIVYYIVFVRKRIVNRWNLEQVLDINKTMFSSSLLRSEESVEVLQKEENVLREIPQNIVNEAFEPINELVPIKRLGLAVYNEDREQLEFASYPQLNMLPDIIGRSFVEQSYLTDKMTQAFPLNVEVGDKQQCVGVLYLERQEGAEQESELLLLGLITRYVSIVIFNAVVKLAMRYRDIESAYEDAHRASREDSMLHVQNLVLDNCLSTIKHETVYYPNKIKQIIGRLLDATRTTKEEEDDVDAISELIEYYKGIFTILSSNASRQLEEVTFRRITIPVAELLRYAERYFKKLTKGKEGVVSLTLHCPEEKPLVLGDLNLLYFLLENLLEEALSTNLPGELILQAQVTNDGFVRFLFTDNRRTKSTEELNQLFYPNLERMTSGERGELKGTEYLVCKQIIRDHDEYAGRRGCRINAEPAAMGVGFSIYFTLPERKK
ncbi:DUF5113 domain-containing protein [Bacteroides sp. 214]|uniref:sensor histidine kinase n=1 Tax=Bacteroides sp. 214 TaxID=2302935 RepID=UPI0013D0108B|nr:DUF5113 domain-containing protein [Bacteroides sp. 214]NDW11528.1 DUF5113 domain-containing protein [Bacteroides sp. 214]